MAILAEEHIHHKPYISIEMFMVLMTMEPAINITVDSSQIEAVGTVKIYNESFVLPLPKRIAKALGIVKDSRWQLVVQGHHLIYIIHPPREAKPDVRS